MSRYRAGSKSNHNRDGTFLSACEGFDSSVIATVEPAPVQRCVLYTFADVPLTAGRLVVSQVASTALQEHQRRSQERGFDDGEHARDPLFIIVPLWQARRRGRRHHPPCPQRMDERSTEGRRKSGPITAIFITQAARVKAMGPVGGNGLRSTFAVWASAVPDPPPLKWSDLRYVFDIQEDCNGKEAIQA